MVKHRSFEEEPDKLIAKTVNFVEEIRKDQKKFNTEESTNYKARYEKLRSFKM